MKRDSRADIDLNELTALLVKTSEIRVLLEILGGQR